MNAILEYYQAIKNGDIIVGRWIEQWYEQIIKGLEDKKYYLSPKKANAAIIFIENFVRHHEGQLAPQRLKLELWQKALLSVIFGIVDDTGNRQFREVIVEVARKNGKTLLAAGIATYMAYMDGEYGARIYFAAPKLEQASLCFDAFYQTIFKEPLLNREARKRRTDVYIEQSNTTAKPLAFSAKKSDGLNISLCIADECSSWQGDAGLKFYEVIKSSFGARKQPLLLSISTAGYVTDGIFDELIRRATRVILGDSKETRLAPFLYTIDDPTKWNDISELQKSNPNLGVSVSVDYMLEEIAVAEGSLSKRVEFLTKYCNIKQNSSQAWLSTEAIKRASGQELRFEDFKGRYAVIGIDLSQTTDLTCVTAVINKDGVLNCFAKFFLPEEKIEEATARDQLPYGIYIQRGLLQPSGQNFVDYHDVEKWILDLQTKYEIYPIVIGYDRYSAQYLIQDLNDFGFKTDDVYQGYNLTPVIHEFEGLIKDGRINIGDNDLLKIHLLNTALKMENETDRVKIVKMSPTEHIDGCAALLDAMCVRQKWYADFGSFLERE